LRERTALKAFCTNELPVLGRCETNRMGLCTNLRNGKGLDPVAPPSRRFARTNGPEGILRERTPPGGPGTRRCETNRMGLWISLRNGKAVSRFAPERNARCETNRMGLCTNLIICKDICPFAPPSWRFARTNGPPGAHRYETNRMGLCTKLIICKVVSPFPPERKARCETNRMGLCSSLRNGSVARALAPGGMTATERSHFLAIQVTTSRDTSTWVKVSTVFFPPTTAEGRPVVLDTGKSPSLGRGVGPRRPDSRRFLRKSSPVGPAGPVNPRRDKSLRTRRAGEEKSLFRVA
jgi:hypothetical protein